MVSIRTIVNLKILFLFLNDKSRYRAVPRVSTFDPGISMSRKKVAKVPTYVPHTTHLHELEKLLFRAKLKMARTSNLKFEKILTVNFIHFSVLFV